MDCRVCLRTRASRFWITRRQSRPSVRASRCMPATSSPMLATAITRCSRTVGRSEEHTSELQSQSNLVCRLLLEKKKKHPIQQTFSANVGHKLLPLVLAGSVLETLSGDSLAETLTTLARFFELHESLSAALNTCI